MHRLRGLQALGRRARTTRARACFPRTTRACKDNAGLQGPRRLARTTRARALPRAANTPAKAHCEGSSRDLSGLQELFSGFAGSRGDSRGIRRVTGTRGLSRRPPKGLNEARAGLQAIAKGLGDSAWDSEGIRGMHGPTWKEGEEDARGGSGRRVLVHARKRG